MVNQVVRYEPVVGLLSELAGGRLVDVGSGSVGIAPWLGRKWDVVAVDESFTDYGGSAGPAKGDGAERVLADARRLPFADGEFHAGVALDLLEHVDEADRPAVVGELARVTSHRLIVGCPAGEAAWAADERLLQWCRGRGISGEGWLLEHIDNGFPEPTELREWLEPHGQVRLIGNESAVTHERLMRIEIRRPGTAASRLATRILLPRLKENARGRGVTAALVRGLLRGRDRAPTYRTIAVLDRVH